jgi:rSAM/selenodomain-associated transferase 1
MATCRANREVSIAILAKAPVPGLAKTRLIPALGADGAARLQARFISIAVETAQKVGAVTLWAAPHDAHPVFRQLADRVKVVTQVAGDLGARMLAAVSAASGPVLVIGTDCPALTPDHLRVAAELLNDGIDVVVDPADDGGYALIGMKTAEPRLFADMAWSTPTVMAETRRRLARLNLSWREPARLWDVDLPEDLERMRTANLTHLLRS